MFGADSEIRTRTKGLGSRYATVTSYPLMEISLTKSGFFYKFGFQIHRTAFDFTADIVVAIWLQADAFNFGALFDHLRAAFDFQIFHQYHGVAVCQRHAVGIQNLIAATVFAFIPSMAALGAGEAAAVVIAVGRTAFGANVFAHGFLSVMQAVDNYAYLKIYFYSITYAFLMALSAMSVRYCMPSKWIFSSA